MANNSPDLFSNWFKTAAELTEATMRATAQVQLDNLDLWMEAMTSAARANMPHEETPFLSSMMGSFGGRETNESQPDASNAGRKKPEQAKAREQSAGKAQGDRSRHSASRKAGASRAHSSAKSGSRPKAKHARRR